MHIGAIRTRLAVASLSLAVIVVGVFAAVTGSTAGALRTRRMRGHVGTDFRPRDSAVARAMHELRAIVNHALIVRRHFHGRHALESIRHRFAAVAV